MDLPTYEECDDATLVSAILKVVETLNKMNAEARKREITLSYSFTTTGMSEMHTVTDWYVWNLYLTKAEKSISLIPLDKDGNP